MQIKITARDYKHTTSAPTPWTASMKMQIASDTSACMPTSHHKYAKCAETIFVRVNFAIKMSPKNWARDSHESRPAIICWASPTHPSTQTPQRTPRHIIRSTIYAKFVRCAIRFHRWASTRSWWTSTETVEKQSRYRTTLPPPPSSAAVAAVPPIP